MKFEDVEYDYLIRERTTITYLLRDLFRMYPEIPRCSTTKVIDMLVEEGILIREYFDPEECAYGDPKSIFYPTNEGYEYGFYDVTLENFIGEPYDIVALDIPAQYFLVSFYLENVVPSLEKERVKKERD